MNWGCIISLAVHFSSLAGFMNIGPVYLALWIWVQFTWLYDYEPVYMGFMNIGPVYMSLWIWTQITWLYKYGPRLHGFMNMDPDYMALWIWTQFTWDLWIWTQITWLYEYGPRLHGFMNMSLFTRFTYIYEFEHKICYVNVSVLQWVRSAAPWWLVDRSPVVPASTDCHAGHADPTWRRYRGRRTCRTHREPCSVTAAAPLHGPWPAPPAPSTPPPYCVCLPLTQTQFVFLMYKNNFWKIRITFLNAKIFFKYIFNICTNFRKEGRKCFI